jgi:predicted amidophosphoribosyltransferase
LDGLVGVFSYRNSIKQAVKGLKYRFVQEMGREFVETAYERIDPAILKFIKREGFLVVPVPLHRVRERWRGFNQSVILGKLLAERLDLEFFEVLERVKDTRALAELRVRLTGSEREELKKRYVSITQRKLAERRLFSDKKSRARAREMRGAFQVKSPKFPPGRARGKVKSKKLLLVDDVWTSGATMTECAKVLKRSGASSVWGFTFARGGR